MRRQLWLWAGLCAITLTCPSLGQTTEDPIARLMSTNSFGFLHIHVTEVWNSPQLEPFREVLQELGPEELDRFNEQFTPRLSDVESLTVILPSADRHAPTLPEGDPELKTALFVVRTKSPLDRVGLLKTLGPEIRTKAWNDRDYFFEENAWAGLVILDDRTFVYGAEESIVEMLRGERPSNAKGPLAELWAAESNKHAIIMGVNPSSLMRPNFLREVPANLRPLLKARHFLMTADVGDSFVLTARMRFSDAEQTEAGKQSAEAVVALAREGLVRLRELLELSPKPNPFGLQDLPPRFSRMFGRVAIRWADRHLKDLQLTTEGNDVAVSLDLTKAFPADDKTALSALFTMLTVAAGEVMARYDRPFDPEEDFNLTGAGLELQEVADALERYRRDHGHYPTPAISQDGKPLLSWRVAILPYLRKRGDGYSDDYGFGEPEEEGTYADLYERFHLDEPWDSTHNRALLSQLPGPYRPVRFPYYHWHNRKTGVMLVVGDTALTPPTGHATPKAAKDGPGMTILAVQRDHPEDAVYWSKPADLTWKKNGDLPRLDPITGFGFLAIMADGRVRVVPGRTPAKVIRALVSPAGREKLDPSVVQPLEGEEGFFD